MATVLQQGFSVELRIDDKTVFKKDVTIKDPQPICASSVPGLDFIKDLCVVLDNIDLTQKSACVTVTCKIKLGPSEQKVKVKLGCFKIPAAEQPDTVDASVITMSQEIPQSSPDVSEPASDEISISEDDMNALMEELSAAIADEIDIELNGTLKGN